MPLDFVVTPSKIIDQVCHEPLLFTKAYSHFCSDILGFSLKNVTILEGTIYIGMGEKLDETKTTALTAGGFTALPGKMGHFAFSKEGTVIQVHAMGPFAITYYNPADDPRTK